MNLKVKNMSKNSIIDNQEELEQRRLDYIEMIETSKEGIISKSRLNRNDEVGVLTIPNNFSKEQIEAFKKAYADHMRENRNHIKLTFIENAKR
jgi:hypothetical protein